MADPKLETNPVTVGFVDTSPAVSQRVPVTAAQPLPVTIAGTTTISAGGTATAAAPTYVEGATDQPLSLDLAGYLRVGSRAEAPVTAATATATKSYLIGLQYNSSGVTFTDGQQGSAQAGSKGSLQVAGGVASGATDAENPVKIGGKYNSTLPTFTNGQRGDVQIGTRGSLNVTLFAQDNTTQLGSTTTFADGKSSPLAYLNNANFGFKYNGSTWDFDRSVINATNSTGTGIAAVGNLAQFDDVSPTIITENQFGNLRMTADRMLYSIPSYSFTGITTSTTTTVKSGAGILHAVTINTKGTVASTITIYDNTAGSGTKIGIIDSLNLSGAFFFDVAFATGLTLVTTGTLAPDITVSYK